MKVKSIIIAILALLMAVSCFGQKKKSIYDFTVKDIKGNDVSLANYKGKVLISKDGQTIQRFEPMVIPKMLESAIQEMM